ncbi:hypothetical protein [Halovenus salina]|uniref:Uncharacterized protein n=1 Tax=Halovenus salina TaxID=1510225 RepID=A0ABD5VYJ5_9EURY
MSCVSEEVPLDIAGHEDRERPSGASDLLGEEDSDEQPAPETADESPQRSQTKRRSSLSRCWSNWLKTVLSTPGISTSSR